MPICDSAEVAVADQVEREGIGGRDRNLLVAVFDDAVNLLNRGAEDKALLLADLLPNLNVSTVHGAAEKSAVHGELHVAGAGSLSASGGDLLGEVGPGDELLGGRHVVVGEEDHLQQIAHIGVVVNLGAHGIDQLDDLLRHGVTGGSLASDDDHLGGQLRLLLGRHRLDLGVRVNAAHDVQQLPLVLVNALDLRQSIDG
eukprot:1191851-Prorocentrum_minimum.AAC.2